MPATLGRDPLLPRPRVAVVATDSTKAVARYLPSGYSVMWAGPASDLGLHTDYRHAAIVAGVDVAGWTLDGYVLPRLASGLHYGRELEWDDPIVEDIPDGEWYERKAS